MWNFTPLPYAHVSLQTWVSFWTLFCCVDLFFYLILSPNHHFSYSCNYSLMSDKASFYWMPICLTMFTHVLSCITYLTEYVRWLCFASEAQRGYMTCLRSHRTGMTKLGLNEGLPGLGTQSFLLCGPLPLPDQVRFLYDCIASRGFAA